MHEHQRPYRQLSDGLLSYGGGAAYDDLLRPWVAANEGERRWLDGLRTRAGGPVPPVTREESWRLYGLSRIVDLLQLSFASAAENRSWKVAPVTRDEYARFMDAAESAELLRHRCFVTCAKPNGDRWPYGLTLTENA